MGLFMVTVNAVLVPVYEPEPEPVQLISVYRVPSPPGSGEVTLTVAFDPALYHPAPEGLPRADVTVSWYWVLNVAVRVELMVGTV
jgi:hypothetical protein